MDWAVFAILAVIIAYQRWVIWHEQRIHDEKERDLLNRVMTRNYETYVQGQVVVEQAKKQDIQSEQEEQGIPV